MSPTVRNRIALGTIFLGAVICILLHQALFMGQALVPAGGIFLFPPWGPAAQGAAANHLLADQFLNLHPFQRFLHDQLLDGRLPLWNPLIACGVPHLAAMQTAALFPINLLLAPIDPFVASGWAAFLKLFLAGAFMILYMRRLKAGAAAAVLSATAFSLSGFMVLWLGHAHVNSAMWLPLLFLLIDLGLENPRKWALFCVAFAMMLLGGHPGTIMHVTMAAGAYALWGVGPGPHKRGGGSRVRRTALFAGAVAVGALLAAPQLLPFAEYLGRSSAGPAAELLQRWSFKLSPWTLLHFLQPYLSGSPVTGFEGLSSVLGLSPRMNFNERTAYVGVLTLFLAAFALRFRRDRRTGFFGALAALSLAGAYGAWPLPLLFSLTPGLNAVAPTRLLLLTGFAIAVLAGLGLDRLAAPVRPRGAKRFSMLFGAAAGVVAFAAAYLIGSSDIAHLLGAESFVRRQFLVPAAGAVLAAGLGSRLLARRPTAAKLLCTFWTAFDLLCFAVGCNPAVPRSKYYPDTPVLSMIKQDPGIFRVSAVGAILPPNTGMMYGLQDVRGRDFLSVRRYEELITGKAGDFFFYSAARAAAPLPRLLNIKYLLAPRNWAPPSSDYRKIFSGKVAAYALKSRLDRAVTLYDYEVLPGKDAVLQKMLRPGFDPARTLLLEEPPPPRPGRSSRKPAAARKPRIVSYAPDEIIIDAALPRPGFLLLLDTYYPGWRATVNGAATPLLRADYNFRAVLLPAGRSEVRFAYAPASLRIGMILFVLAAALIIFVYRRPTRKRKIEEA